ncbi:MAG TPA: HprK-related kinase A [Sphingobium sp.]|uniref:HprK-related kinase A n=1 Tax=Sphingobium sp. TaxID=1912891 RepID=UPI002ED59EB4
MKHSIQLRVGPAVFRVGSAWASPVEALRRLYRDYPDASGEVADFTVRLQPAKPWRRHFRPSIFIAGDHWLADAAPMALAHGLLAAEMGMNLQMALGWRRHLLLHAATVEKDGRAIILSGESGSGKSTLAAMLGEHGWRLMGDEFALVDLVDGTLAPFPRLVSLKNAAIEAVRTVAGEDRLGPLMAATPKGDIRHLIPRSEHVVAMDIPAKPVLLLFPRFGAEGEARPVGEAECFVRLTQASTNYVALGEAGFRALTSLVSSVPAVGIDYASGAEGMAMVEALWAETQEMAF